MKGICENAKSLEAFPLADSIALRLGQKHRDCIFSICANRERAACILWFKQTRSKFHLWWLVITCNECLFLDHPNPSLGMSKIILPGRNLQVTKSLTQISAICKTWRTCEMHIWHFYVPASQKYRDFSKADWTATIEKGFQNDGKRWGKKLVPDVLTAIWGVNQHSAAFLFDPGREEFLHSWASHPTFQPIEPVSFTESTLFGSRFCVNQRAHVTLSSMKNRDGRQTCPLGVFKNSLKSEAPVAVVLSVGFDRAEMLHLNETSL